jgi:hypothetical protein
LLSVSDLLLDPFSEGCGFISDFFVAIGDLCHLSDGCSAGFFLRSVQTVISVLGINVGLFQISQNLESRVDGVSGSGLHFQ